MKHKMTALSVLALWLVLTASAWFAAPQELSLSERRPLAQFPEFRLADVFSGSFMEDFESYSLDQFPLRDPFRRLKSLFHYHVLGQKDNNGIYLVGDMAVKQEYPLNRDSVAHAADRFTAVYEKYLSGSRVFMAVVPDKGQYLAQPSGHLSLSYRELCQVLQELTPWATHIDLLGTLDAGDYYGTDTHWRQEQLLDAAGALCAALGTEIPREEDYSAVPLEQPFYGVYYGQAALPMEPETICLMQSELLSQCRVYDYETGSYGAVYDLSKLESRDLYDVFLSGAKSLLTIENPAGEPGKELLIFRDSFGSAMAPLLVGDYSRVTLVDIRYLPSSMLPQYLDFHGQDVLFLYSTLVLNNSSTIK